MDEDSKEDNHSHTMGVVHQSNSSLAICAYRREIVTSVAIRPVTFIKGFTGCGKSTMVPQFIVDDCRERNQPFNIVVTQPRRIAAQSIAARVSKELGTRLGGLVGYKIGLEQEVCTHETKVLYCTTGLLKKMLVDRPYLNDWSHVIVDEVHERDQDLDLLLLLCNRFVRTNSRGVRLVLMSATFEVDKFMEYFKQSCGNFPIYPSLIMVEDKRRRFEVKTTFLEGVVSTEEEISGDFRKGARLYETAIKACKSFLQRLDTLELRAPAEFHGGAVLVFLPGEAEIKRVKRHLENEREQNGNHKPSRQWIIQVLHSRLPLEDAQAVFSAVKFHQRKIILATNIAESSITIPDICYVIDFCLTKNLVLDRSTNLVSLVLEWADRSNCRQRAGRVGRLRDGLVVRLVPREVYNRVLPSRHPAEMLRAPLDKIILDVKAIDIDSPKALLSSAIDPPDLSNMEIAMMQLKQCGALLTTAKGVDEQLDGDLTVIGRFASSMPIDVRLSKLILLGLILDVLDESIIIAAALSGKPIFLSPIEERFWSYSNKLYFANGSFSDCISFLNAYRSWKDYQITHKAHTFGDKRRLREWCRLRGLSFKALCDMEALIIELYDRLHAQGIQRVVTEPGRFGSKSEEVLQWALFGAFYPNLFCLRSFDELSEDSRRMQEHDALRTVVLRGFPSIVKSKVDKYLPEVKNLFKTICPLESMRVETVGSIVFVTFTGNDSLLSLERVYKALKMGREEQLLIRVCISDLDDSGGFEKRVDDKIEVRLKGPENPLETNLECLNEPFGVLTAPKIEAESVNSVLLHRNPESDFDHYLISFSAAVSAYTEQVRLRNTNFLPNIPGFAPILLLCFAPFVELRCDPDRCRYTGCLVGLGTRRRDWHLTVGELVPYNPQGDLECVFDVHISSDDIKTINEIRRNLNEILCNDELSVLSNFDFLLPRRDEIERRISSLVTKPRTRVPQYQQKMSHQWLQWPKAMYRSIMVDDSKDALKTISSYLLKEEVTTVQIMEKVIEELLELHYARGQTQKKEKEDNGSDNGQHEAESKYFVPKVCPVCNDEVKLTNAEEVDQHLNGAKHKESYRAVMRSMDELLP